MTVQLWLKVDIREILANFGLIVEIEKNTGNRESRLKSEINDGLRIEC